MENVAVHAHIPETKDKEINWEYRRKELMKVVINFAQILINLIVLFRKRW